MPARPCPDRPSLTRIAACALVALLALPGGLAAQTRADPEATSGRAASPTAHATRHMIAAAHPLAAEAGREMLRRGGSAADAAIAALLVLNVVEPQSSGLGGGAFALVHGPDGLTTLDARETAPMAADADLFIEGVAPLDFSDAVASGRSVGVPGLPALLEALHARHGRLPWADLVAPAIALARDGFAVSPRLAASVAAFADRLEGTDAAAVFLPGGVPLAEGATLRQPKLAATLERIAAEGADAVYRWPIAAGIVGATRRGVRPGALSLDDLAAYEVVERAPVCVDYRAAWRVCGMGPPSSGATTVGQILGIMDWAGTGGLGLDSPRLWHLFAEASRLAYADRALYLADPDRVQVPTRGLIDRGYLRERARLVPRFRASAGRAEAGTPPWREAALHAPDLQPGRPGTTHLSVVDGDGLAIALTASIETAFGSARMAAGFLLNNQLTDFAFRPVAEDGLPVANAPGPGKRPRSSMAPTIAYRLAEPDAPAVIAGSPGGSRIPEYVAGALIAIMDFGLDPAAAAARGHVSQRNLGKLVLEAGAHSPALAEGLAAMGHEMAEAEMASGLHILIRTPDGWAGGADPRREGVALGD
ncbi:gamma-glutamyltransferase family protein [Limibaculum sp. FT325]|uniref:gamma-glutamyltransferase family protein n=1 Tax=Thermohalobaculum sediminis TaxID=2939436 RepID=UPI0020C017FC|nr:gamma-glutamyltransferase family protein [Limibaculum sediminis]MCL5779146.1 gamma-glutamyltransferase family protein [Limibaculum sediminis]